STAAVRPDLVALYLGEPLYPRQPLTSAISRVGDTRFSEFQRQLPHTAADHPRRVGEHPRRRGVAVTSDERASGDGRKRILTGVCPTGALHLGHYVGALENWIRLQQEYECFFLIADYQVSDYADDFDRVRESVLEVALDWLAVGLDPSGSHFTIESQVPEHAELTTWLGWWTPMGMLERNPTLKSEMADLSARGSVPVAFFNYPLMQVANILMPKAHLVPVG